MNTLLQPKLESRREYLNGAKDDRVKLADTRKAVQDWLKTAEAQFRPDHSGTDFYDLESQIEQHKVGLIITGVKYMHNMYRHFMSFLYSEMAQIVEILPDMEQGFSCLALSISWLLMTW